MDNKLKTIATLVVTAVVLGILAWWLGVVASKLSTPPVVVGKSVTVDVFQRSKDILLVVLPLGTTGVGFWLGNQNTQRIESQAKNERERFATEMVSARAETMDARTDADDHRQAAALSEQKLSLITAAVEDLGGPRERASIMSETATDAPSQVPTGPGDAVTAQRQLDAVRAVLGTFRV